MEPRSTTHAGIRLIAEPGLSAEARPGSPSTCRRGRGSSSAPLWRYVERVDRAPASQSGITGIMEIRPFGAESEELRYIRDVSAGLYP